MTENIFLFGLIMASDETFYFWCSVIGFICWVFLLLISDRGKGVK
jgi:hypothetical protein